MLIIGGPYDRQNIRVKKNAKIISLPEIKDIDQSTKSWATSIPAVSVPFTTHNYIFDTIKTKTNTWYFYRWEHTSLDDVIDSLFKNYCCDIPLSKES